MDSQSRRQRTVDRRHTDQLGQSSRRIAQANEDRLRLRRQRYVEQQAERRAASSSEPVASGSQRGIRRKVMEMVDKLKSLSGESVEYESKILTRFLQHSTISKALKVVEIMSLKEQRAAKLLLANLATGLQTSMHDITLADEFHVGADHEVLSDQLAVGDVFAVKGSSDEEAQTEYWLLRCTGTKQKITEKEISCLWNTE
ncbi:hypothetical protein R1sor_010892 [Riccia sorocarpa]|uniref:Uncharacterized protein n=1 Tax=Riccia sorocarpa TaxID=122646 RepID=A0ABD3I0N6_9MARC